MFVLSINVQFDALRRNGSYFCCSIVLSHREYTTWRCKQGNGVMARASAVADLSSRIPHHCYKGRRCWSHTWEMNTEQTYLCKFIHPSIHPFNHSKGNSRIPWHICIGTLLANILFRKLLRRVKMCSTHFQWTGMTGCNMDSAQQMH